MKDEELVKIFDNLNKENNHQKIHEHYQRKIKKLYQELIKYKYSQKNEREKLLDPSNENDKALQDLKAMGVRPSAFVNKKIATRALIAQDKLTYYGQALAEDELDMTWIQLCTMLKVTDKKQVLRTVKGYHDKLPNYLNLKTTLVTLINTVDPLGAVVPMSARNSDECLKYSERLIQHITKIAEHTARTKPTMLTPIREPLPIRRASKKSSFGSAQKPLPKNNTIPPNSRSIPTTSNRSVKSNSFSNVSSKVSDINLSVSRGSTKSKSKSTSIRDDVSITSSMIERIINEVPKNIVANASIESAALDDSFLNQFNNSLNIPDETVNTDFLNEISIQLRKGHNGSSVSDL
eukprot:NODE_235_length_13458_cov_0.279737.p4 type:complete len:349 gc:universal NODE_235_length_13458_cov_0.279737:1980-3026(+)